MIIKFGENFKRLRKEKNITQEKIADILEVSAQSVSRWELGICYPDLEMLPAIANYFGVSVDSLLANDTLSKEEDRALFDRKIDSFPYKGEEVIQFVKEYCKKYPENDYYAHVLIHVIRNHVIGDEEKTELYMPLLLKNAERLLQTRYRNSVIQYMASVCKENELDKWLDMSPYKSNFSRRSCLVVRAIERNDTDASYVQQGLEMFETIATQLDSRCSDRLGAKKKARYQRGILRVVASFGEGGTLPDGWKTFYAYKQLVLAACLFGSGETDEAWRHFDSAMEKYQYIFSLQDEWLDLGGELFSNLKVSKDWNYAIDERGERHKLLAMVNLSFCDAEFLHHFLTNRCWAWFNSVRETEKYQAAVAWAKDLAEQS